MTEKVKPKGFGRMNLKGSSAEKFIEQDKVPLTGEQKKYLKECKQTYDSSKVRFKAQRKKLRDKT